ncbi:methyltransferase domain-containing protein, partial [Actinomadura sp. BRA 177]|uniref:methyltransferase domain-containing protein n=1 Tax=Actinomadura sp. BRA 177 TaxID=2745202 RepID=UPI0015955594
MRRGAPLALLLCGTVAGCGQSARGADVAPPTAAAPAPAVAGTAGRGLGVGAGYGANCPHYPPEVTEVVAREPEPRLRARADHAAGAAPVPVTVRPGVAEDLDLDDASFDVAV